VLDAQLLQAGVEGGESIDQLTERVRAVYADMETWRATAIARTETVGGFNAASRLGAVASGVVTSRTWLAAHDDRVRETHAAMDGETITGLAGVYSNGLLHPGDPTAPPSETVNCRCVETYGTD
jgi:SPP1 gp7 family putative phage head morphogenesis protein